MSSSYETVAGYLCLPSPAGPNSTPSPKGTRTQPDAAQEGLLIHMGAELSTARVSRLTALGFDVASVRAALEACDGDVDRAEQLLRQERARRETAARGGGDGGAEEIGRAVNSVLREQRPWSEFGERFLWPEHPRERMLTNLVYYRANYLILCVAATLVAMLLVPQLLFTAGLVAMTFGGAVALGNTPVPHIGPLQLEQARRGGARA
jgi:hypothetical protein